MRKKIISFVLALAVVLPCMFALTACGSAIKENVDYKIDSIEIVWNKDVTAAQKTEALGGDTEDDLTTISDENKAMRMVFEGKKVVVYVLDANGKKQDDHKYVMGYYVADGNILRLYRSNDCRGNNMEFYSEDGKLYMEEALVVLDTEADEEIVVGYIKTYIIEA